MEAAGIPGREADVRPAPDPTGGRSAGFWTPADPGPLGLTGFAATTFVLSFYNANLVGTGGGPPIIVLGVALAYGGIAQLLAGMWEFRTGNTFGAVAFSSFGAFWISFFVLLLTVGNKFGGGFANADVAHNAISVFLYAWAIFTTYMFVASLRTTGVIALVFILLAVTFWLLAIGNASLVGTTNATNSTIKVGGYVGLATAAAAWYGSFAAVMNSTFARTILPVFPLHLVPRHTP
jgi:succinate-acetate transporter protein